MDSNLSYQQNNQSPESRKKFIQGMFDSIVPTYDLLNRLLSLGIDRGWRKKTIRFTKEAATGPVLDLCCGTGDLSRQLRRAGCDIVSLDFSLEMLKKGKETGWLDEKTVAADASTLPFKKESFSAMTIAFGIRNIPDLERFIGATNQALTPGGSLFILELTRPEGFFMKVIYGLYLRVVLPIVGGIISRRPIAYKYLAGTIASFIDPYELAENFRQGGYRETHVHRLTFGIATLIECKKD